MKDDRFRWISERITQRTRSEFWVDRTNRLHDQ
jgi:pyridoxine/pyridoxamine 5'-phosphate oxidase